MGSQCFICRFTECIIWQSWYAANVLCVCVYAFLVVPLCVDVCVCVGVGVCVKALQPADKVRDLLGYHIRTH